MHREGVSLRADLVFELAPKSDALNKSNKV